ERVAFFDGEDGPHLGDGKCFGNEAFSFGEVDVGVVGGEEDVGVVVQAEIGQEGTGAAVLDGEADAVGFFVGGVDGFHRFAEAGGAGDGQFLGRAGGGNQKKDESREQNDGAEEGQGGAVGGAAAGQV